MHGVKGAKCLDDTKRGMQACVGVECRLKDTKVHVCMHAW